ncbi:hypothetical protein BM526_15450 [Alteromonas mediterranea]|uniref:hypothetical protein n=1 Tax=Alteromonas mediterranea TaxID=314275 RepID=UPI0009031065|nr:hypothetical protein [Alteromonas mediterranea]APE03121.1 hypothetical protein BM526_15450 [Alteromonas mediterranea]
MSLTAIDAALSIAKSKERFYSSVRLNYQSDNDYKVVMQSRTGLFLNVWYNGNVVDNYREKLEQPTDICVSNIESFYRYRLLPLFNEELPETPTVHQHHDA